MTATVVTTVHNNFARAQIDHDLDGRFDLPIYQTGAKAFENFISNFKGNAIFRTGFEMLLTYEDCGLAEFRFSTNQNYLLALTDGVMRFASYDANNEFGWVLDGGASELEVTTPYTLEEAKALCKRKAFTQNFDSMIFAAEGHEPRELKRLAANDFRFTTYSRKDDPFPTAWASTKTITNVTQATEAVFTISGHGYSVNDRFKVAGVGGMTEINGWTAAVIEVVDANNVKTDIDTTTFTAHSGSSGTAAKVTAGDYPRACGYRKGRLWYAGTTNKPTTVWGSEDGQFKTHTLPTSVLPESALQFTIAELDAPIEWLFNGSNSLLAATINDIVPIHGGSPGDPITAETVDTSSTDADGAHSAAPLAKDGLVFYVTNDKRRLNFFSYDLLSESFDADDANQTSYDITAGGIEKLRYVKTREDLIYALRGDGKLLSCNFNKKERIVGWHIHPSEAYINDIASISDNNGVQQLFALNEYDGAFYIERRAPFLEFKQRKDFVSAIATDAIDDLRNQASDYDDEAHYRYVAEQLRDAIYLDNATTVNDYRETTLTFDPDALTITASASSFTLNSEGHHIVFKTETGYESGRFNILNYVSATVVEVEVLQSPKKVELVDGAFVETELTSWASWYLTFNTLSGLSRFNGTEVSVVADGGYLNTFAVSSGAVELGTEVASVVVGKPYTGYIESFTLGFQAQGVNTQATQKVVSRVGLRLHDTSGGRFGTSRYRLDPVQKLGQNDLNYLPPKPINGTVFVEYSDDHQVDRGFSVMQDTPLPMVITAALVECSYAVV